MSTSHPAEPHGAGIAGKLNWLRAGVLGANDGIVSVAAIVVGVAGATSSIAPIITAGAAGLVGGAISMALGEYVSVSSQRDSQHALIAKERRELAEMPAEEMTELANLYQAKGLSPATARKVAEELTSQRCAQRSPRGRARHQRRRRGQPLAGGRGIRAGLLHRGACCPCSRYMLPPELASCCRSPSRPCLSHSRITGALSARIGGSPWLRPTVRVVVGGAIALAATFLIGTLLGTTGDRLTW